MASARASPLRSRAQRRPRRRRSHAERTAQTRALLMDAVVESIAEVGLARTTAPEIARRAGVTWGAVQHHFGGKDGMLVSVLDDSFRRFAERLEGIPLEGTSLEKRVGHFIDRAWEHFGSAHYRSTYEILIHYLGREDTRAKRDWRDRMSRDWDRIWRRLFADARVSPRRHFVLQQHTIAVLSGLASTLMLEGGEPALRPAVLELLKQTLARELSQAPRSGARSEPKASEGGPPQGKAPKAPRSEPKASEGGPPQGKAPKAPRSEPKASEGGPPQGKAPKAPRSEPKASEGGPLQDEARAGTQ